MFPLNTVLFPGRERAAARLRGPLPRAGAPPAAGRGPDRAAVRLGRHPRGLRGRRARRAVAVPGRLPGAADRGRGSTPTAPSTSSRSASTGSRLERLDTTGTFPVGHVVTEPRTPTPIVPDEIVERARATFDGLPGGARGRSAATRSPGHAAAGPDVPLLDPGRRRARSPCPSGRRCWRPRTPPIRLAHGDRPAARGAARDERDPVAAGHRGGPHPLVAQLMSPD